jgi:hydrogenase maturation protein HypF
MDGSDLTTLSPGPALVRWRVRVRGIVQGVGFRPFVYGLALRLQLVGWVRNDADGVIIEAEGTFASLVALVDALRSEAPPLARVDAVMHEATAPRGDPAFAIVQSADGAQRNTLIAPDSATCPDCVRELFDPTDRRYRYPFINCTNCGPRFTIVADVPYDRPNTTMQPFALCARCQREYDDPLDRRFHAQPNACPDCGPQLAFEKTRQQGDADQVSGEAALAAAVHALLSGQIVAIKGLGGYHLACDAHNAEAVQALLARAHAVPDQPCRRSAAYGAPPPHRAAGAPYRSRAGTRCRAGSGRIGRDATLHTAAPPATTRLAAGAWWRAAPGASADQRKS